MANIYCLKIHLKDAGICLLNAVCWILAGVLERNMMIASNVKQVTGVNVSGKLLAMLKGGKPNV